jgi:hypothetical protein
MPQDINLIKLNRLISCASHMGATISHDLVHLFLVTGHGNVTRRFGAQAHIFIDTPSRITRLVGFEKRPGAFQFSILHKYMCVTNLFILTGIQRQLLW